MTGSSVWVLIALIGAGTYLLRLSFLGPVGRTGPPESIRRALGRLPAAMMAALVMQSLAPAADPAAAAPKLLAGAVAAVFAYRTGSVLLTIGTGLVSLWALRAWLG